MLTVSVTLILNARYFQGKHKEHVYLAYEDVVVSKHFITNSNGWKDSFTLMQKEKVLVKRLLQSKLFICILL